MKLFNHPPPEQWPQLLQRPAIDNSSLQDKVRTVLQDVQTRGDAAVRHYTLQFDGVSINDPKVTPEEIEEAAAQLTPALKAAIQQAADNIKRFHEKQLGETMVVETMPGVRCWRKSVGIEKVGLYIPGGTAPLFSTLLMLAIPATLAGCREIILCSPPGKDGKLHPAILFAAQLTGVTAVYKIGGVQAIAAMAYGTESVPKMYKLFGPGNQYVTCAKQLVQQEGVAIDMPAGPSEVCVLADKTADPSFVAADLLSQAEHGTDSQVLLVTDDASLIPKVEAALAQQLEQLPRKTLAAQALDNSSAIVVEDIAQGILLANAYAAEHLIIACANDEEIAEQVVNAGSVFLGNYSPESVGDYASGTNHTLPTNGFARAYSGVSVDSFVKKMTYQKLTRQGLQNIAETVQQMAQAEGLEAHAQAVRIRL